MSRPVRPAATLILMRERPAGRPEVLMIERAATMQFAAGALVFPGGRVDEHDMALAGHFGGDAPDDLAARIAAIRETIEETGIAVGLDPLPPPDQLAVLRARLAQGDRFGELIDAMGLGLDLDRLTPFARWHPPLHAARRFDTRFYVAAAPADAVESADGSETVLSRWATPADLVGENDSGSLRMMWPTLANLVRLAQFDSHDAARADGQAHGHHVVVTSSIVRDGSAHFSIPEAMGYPLTSIPRERVLVG